MLSCKQATRIMSEAQDRQLGMSERMALQLHLLICGGCRNFGHQMHSLRKISRIYASGKTGQEDKPD
jgi:hypothetical protein